MTLHQSADGRTAPQVGHAPRAPHLGQGGARCCRPRRCPAHPRRRNAGGRPGRAAGRCLASGLSHVRRPLRWLPVWLERRRGLRRPAPASYGRHTHACRPLPLHFAVLDTTEVHVTRHPATAGVGRRGARSAACSYTAPSPSAPTGLSLGAQPAGRGPPRCATRTSTVTVQVPAVTLRPPKVRAREHLATVSPTAVRVIE